MHKTKFYEKKLTTLKKVEFKEFGENCTEEI